MKVLSLLSCTLALLGCDATMAAQGGSAAEIPFPSALADAEVRVAGLNSPLDDALIIGNGDINALVWTEQGAVVMTLTKNDVWDARLDTKNDPPLPTLARLKELGKTGGPIGDPILPEGMKWTGPDSYHSHAYPCPRACARVRLNSGASAQTTRTATLNLRRAFVRVDGGQDGPPHVEVRALADRNVFLIQSPANAELLPIESPEIPAAARGETNGVAWVHQVIPGDLDWQGMSFAVALARRGEQSAVAIVTSRTSQDVVADAVKRARSTAEAKAAQLVQRHEEEWNRFWSRSGIQMEDELLQRTWYRSLYFLRCVSKPGVMCPGLFAGLVNDAPAWHGDYHTNYNIQQTFWAAYAANHPELAEPYDRLICEYLPRAQWLARQIFSMRGAYYPHVLFAYEPPDPAACQSARGRQYIHHTWGMTLGVSGFTVQPLWWHYKYAPDQKLLEEGVYPPLREVALFYAEFVEQCEGNDKVVLAPTVSPEHWGWTPRWERNRNCAFDIAYVRFTLEAAIEAAQTLGRDAVLVERWQRALKRLLPYPLHGDPPVVVDVEGAPPIEYNIPVPANPVFPADVVTWQSPQEEKELFARTIAGLRWNGNNATVMLAVARARLSMAHTQEWLRAEVQQRLRPNGTLTLNRRKPPHQFNDFGHYTEQFGAAMAVSELLVQSVGDVIRLFPALSPGCRAAFVNLRTQGGFLVSADGSAESVTSLKIVSTVGGRLRLLSPWAALEVKRGQRGKWQALVVDEDGIVTMPTQAGEVLEFRVGR